jgi:hypothetical protein
VATREARPAARFETTSRFARGRIIDMLRRTATSSASEIRRALPEPHTAKVEQYLDALERDGLVERDATGDWRLAGAQGSSSIASPKL